MQLSWSDQDRLAEALWATHPEQDRLALDSETLRRLIVVLPGFNDTPQPPDARVLDKILWTWMRLADERCGTVPSAACRADADAAAVVESASPPCYAGRVEENGS